MTINALDTRQDLIDSYIQSKYKRVNKQNQFDLYDSTISGFPPSPTSEQQKQLNALIRTRQQTQIEVKKLDEDLVTKRQEILGVFDPDNTNTDYNIVDSIDDIVDSRIDNDFENGTTSANGKILRTVTNTVSEEWNFTKGSGEPFYAEHTRTEINHLQQRLFVKQDIEKTQNRIDITNIRLNENDVTENPDLEAKLENDLQEFTNQKNLLNDIDARFARTTHQINQGDLSIVGIPKSQDDLSEQFRVIRDSIEQFQINHDLEYARTEEEAVVTINDSVLIAVASAATPAEEITIIDTPTEEDERVINPFGQNPNTQLLKEDIELHDSFGKRSAVDPRIVELFMPKFLEKNPVPTYITIQNISGREIENRVPSVPIVTQDGAEFPSLAAPFSKGRTRYNQFSLTGGTFTFNEKFQIDDTHAEGHTLFAYGKRPEIWTFSGTLINDKYHDWAVKFIDLWEHHLRIGQLVKNNQYALLVVPTLSIAIRCFPLNLNILSSIENETNIPFTMPAFIRGFKLVPEFRNRKLSPIAQVMARRIIDLSTKDSDGIEETNRLLTEAGGFVASGVA